ncbi:MAG: class I SAM-dependent methyltransferase [Candidatus Marinimicrobia bacterium]|nr:class I SAM-dependent methyltransferase [Candidatus Neomarinimicrobiota bacterium]MCF7829171.1 class I SAM-dependent methyltransferase [Candidatus Neomarinimicrobiota bacterium]MCF7881176.1 class I SAM-dependent methyltransferase [Candidatus Neomarinimicrobiota bacterium]
MTSLKEQLRQEFNDWADAGRGDGMRDGHWDMTIQTIDKMKLTGHETVLDLGCGNGWTVRELAKRLPGGKAIGIDISDKMIAEAREKSIEFDNTEFYVSSADALPLVDESFQHVLSVESFYYYPDLEPVLAELLRVLRPDGRFWCVVDLYKENPYSMTWPEKLNVPVHALGESDYRNIFEGYGFRIAAQEKVVDRRPVDEDRFKPGWGTPTFEDYKEYKALGSLLTVAKKPE